MDGARKGGVVCHDISLDDHENHVRTADLGALISSQTLPTSKQEYSNETLNTDRCIDVFL
jgi:hypothetical protein